MPEELFGNGGDFVVVAEVADSYIKLSSGLTQLANLDPSPLDKFLSKVSDYFEKARVATLLLLLPIRIYMVVIFRKLKAG